MNVYRIDDDLVYDCCEHLEYKSDGGFNLRIYEEGFPIGFDKEGLQHILFLCCACGERIERRMIINFISQLKLNFRVKNGDVIELKSKELWRRFLNLLGVE